MPEIYIVGSIILTALIFDYINGFHDAANSIATVVSTRVLSPGKAVMWAAFFNFVAAFGFGTAVAKTVGAGMVDLAIVTHGRDFRRADGRDRVGSHHVVLGTADELVSRAVRRLCGRAIAKAGFGAVIMSGWTKTLLFIVLAPMIGMGVGLLVMNSIYFFFAQTPPSRVDRWFRRLQLASAAGFSLMHGANDAQKTMGIIAGALVTGGYLQMQNGELPIPFWVDHGGAHGDWTRNALGWLAHHSHDGFEDYEAASGRRICRGDGSGCRDLHRDDARRRHQHDAHDHRRHRRRRCDAPMSRRSVGVSRARSSGHGC